MFGSVLPPRSQTAYNVHQETPLKLVHLRKGLDVITRTLSRVPSLRSRAHDIRCLCLLHLIIS